MKDGGVYRKHAAQMRTCSWTRVGHFRYAVGESPTFAKKLGYCQPRSMSPEANHLGNDSHVATNKYFVLKGERQ